MIVKFEVIEGILHGPFPKDIEIDKEIARQIVLERLEFIGDKSYPSLIDTSGIKLMTPEAREYFSSAEASKGIAAAALVSNTRFNNFLMNFLIKVNIIKQHSDLRAFTDKEKAIIWLKKYMNES